MADMKSTKQRMIDQEVQKLARTARGVAHQPLEKRIEYLEKWVSDFATLLLKTGLRAP